MPCWAVRPCHCLRPLHRICTACTVVVFAFVSVVCISTLLVFMSCCRVASKFCIFLFFSLVSFDSSPSAEAWPKQERFLMDEHCRKKCIRNNFSLACGARRGLIKMRYPTNWHRMQDCVELWPYRVHYPSTNNNNKMRQRLWQVKRAPRQHRTVTTAFAIGAPVAGADTGWPTHRLTDSHT